jgi:hypothetical protein
MKSIWEEYSEINEYLLKNNAMFLVVDIDNTLLETTYAALQNRDLFKSKIDPNWTNIFIKGDDLDQYYKDLDLLQDEVSVDYPNDNLIEWVNSTDVPIIIVTLRKSLSSKVASFLNRRITNIQKIETNKDWKSRLQLLPIFAGFVDDHPKVVASNNTMVISDMPWNRHIRTKAPRFKPLHPLEG